MATLPTLQPSRFQQCPVALVAYMAATQAQLQANSEEKVRFAGVIGFLLVILYDVRRILGTRPVEKVTEEVISNPQHDVIYELGKRYETFLFRGFKTVRTGYPPPSSHPSRPSYDAAAENILETMQASGKDHKTAKKQALERDGFRCVVMGAFDSTSVKKYPNARHQYEAHGNSETVVVEACHIVNEAVMQGVGSTNPVNKTHHTARFLTILEKFGLTDRVHALTRKNGVHGPYNIISMQHDFHGRFDDLDLWFVPTYENNSYVLRSIDRATKSRVDRMVVRFSSSTVSLPDPKLLTLHAVCAEVMHLSTGSLVC